MSHDVTLTELMGARFCHDLAGPVSAVDNGLEFLHDEDESMRARALELIETSSKEAVARLQFFRQAYGAAPKEGEVEISHLKTLADNYFAFSKTSLDWPELYTDVARISLGHRSGRLLLNLVIIAASCLIHGGTISVHLEKGEGKEAFTIIAKGNSIKIFPEIAEILSNSTSHPMDKRNVQIHFTALLAKQLGKDIHVLPGENSLELKVEQPVATAAQGNILTKGSIARTHG